MIETVLFFVLGFLVASALALLAVPVLWRRAGVLTQKRIEASMPLSREELRGEIDAVNAEHAMAMRRLEMKAEAIKKKAAQDLVEINTLREQVLALQEKCTERDESIAELRAEGDDLAARLAEAEAESRALAAKLAETEDKLAARLEEVEELSRLYEEASLTASSRQIELVARESDIDSLNETLAILRNQRKEADRGMREAVSEKVRSENALQVERARAEELESKVERLMRSLSTREDQLERQQREITRLKQKIRQSEAERKNEESLDEMKRAKEQLEAQVADLSRQLTLAGEASGIEEGEKPPPRKSEVERLQSRLSTLMRENKKLRVELAESTSATAEQGDEVLRDRISDLAAEIVNMAATLEGPQSPIHQTLSEQSPTGQAVDRPSLADRVRALRAGSTAAE